MLTKRGRAGERALAMLAALGAQSCGGGGGGGGQPAVGPAAPGAARITVDVATAVSTFTPALMFGVNSGFWVDPRDALATKDKVQAAGGFFIRYPGGSASDDYHWNGAGAYDADGHWVPSDGAFAPGFASVETYRGTTSSAYGLPANLTDGDPDSRWLSNGDTDFPDRQWAYVDLGALRTVAAADIAWGTPFGASFVIQWWRDGEYPPYLDGRDSEWLDTSAGVLAGAPGGTQRVAFSRVQARFVRVLMTASSAGPGGAYSIAELHVYGGDDLPLTVNTRGPDQTATVVSSTDPASTPAPAENFDFESFMAYLGSFSPAAVPIITVNVGTGTAQEAAAWVRYANVVKGYGIKYWEIGNEMYGDWETGGPMNVHDYVRRYAAFAAAMKAEDPSIVVVGPSAGRANSSNAGDGKTFMQDFLGLMQARGRLADVGAISVHWYPVWDSSDPSVALATPAQLAAFADTLAGWRTDAGLAPEVPVLMTEYNVGIGPRTPVIADQLAAGLWLAAWMGEFIRHFGPGGGANLWAAIDGWDAGDTTDPAVGDLAYLQHVANPYQYQEHATYWALQLMSQRWAIGGDRRDHTLVAAASSAPGLAAYADRRPDGVLSLLVVNEDPSQAYRTDLDLGAFVPDATAAAWTFDASNYAWDTSAVPYHANPDQPPTPQQLHGGEDGRYTFTFAPFSITVIQLTGHRPQ